jgi:AcrR family transcriptional regulator
VTTLSTPSERRFEKNRQAILNAARSIIMEHGVDGLSMRTLADLVDYSPSALYKYFKDKDEILDELTDEAWTLSAEYSQRHMPASDEPITILMQSGMNIYEFAKEYPAQYQLMMSSTRTSPKSLEEFMEHENFKGLRLLMAQSADSGQLRLPEGFTPDLLAFALWFLIHGASVLRGGLMREFGDDFDTLVEQLNEALVTMLTPK